LQRGVRDDTGGTHHAVSGRRDLLGNGLDRRLGRGLDDFDRRGLRDDDRRLFQRLLLRGGFLRGAGWLRGRLGLLGNRLRLGLFDRGLPAQTFGIGEAADAVRQRVVDARRMALHADLQALAQLEDDLVVDPELAGKLVDPDLLRGQSRSRLCFLCSLVPVV
jgi:hypothetical protein